MAVGPIILSVVGDEFIQGARILVIIWEGATSSGDTITLVDRKEGRLLWSGRTDASQTYLGANFGGEGLHAPFGFKLTQISNGRLLVYLREG